MLKRTKADQIGLSSIDNTKRFKFEIVQAHKGLRNAYMYDALFGQQLKSITKYVILWQGSLQSTDISIQHYPNSLSSNVGKLNYLFIDSYLKILLFKSFNCVLLSFSFPQTQKKLKKQKRKKEMIHKKRL